MLFFLIFCSSFVFFFKSFSVKQIKGGWRLMLLRSPWFWEVFSSFLASLFHKGMLAIGFCKALIEMSNNNCKLGSKEQENVVGGGISLLDLPDLALESILERLLPAELCNMAGVCSSLREICTSDHLWERHLKQKWGGVIGGAACRKWQWHMAPRNRPLSPLDQRDQKGSLGSLSGAWPFSRIKYKFGRRKPRTSLSTDSMMALYLSLESGKFWFPAQVYNRENGHVGFMLSCYDAHLSYDSETNTFRARYSRAIEENVVWDRLRVPPVDIPAHVLHVSDCLNDLRPGDHVEIQWRRSKQFPYGWWYAVIGHLESCDGIANRCCCQYSELVVLEFKQYKPNSQWRRMVINRKDHREVGNEADGFYGGIRKLYKEEEASIWKRHWPKQVGIA